MTPGFWNRLALVATALAALIVPIVIQYQIAASVTEVADATYKSCQATVDDLLETERYEAASDMRQQCYEDRFERDHHYPGWEEWRTSVLGTLIVCAILYALIRAAVATAKWVWRGCATE